LSEYINDLENAGFISKDYSWSMKTGKESRFYSLRLSDNYLRFYLKYIEPRLQLIEKDRIQDSALSSLPGWESILGLQFENLVLNNRKIIFKLLNIQPQDILADNPFFQKKTAVKKGCQIDYLIQTKYKNIYLIEIKFSKNKIGPKVIDDVKSKIKTLSLPRGVAVLPVLIHVNGISNALKEKGYFFKVLDFSQLLQ